MPKSSTTQRVRRADAERGYSVLEALISLTIFLALLTAVLVTYVSSKELFTRGERKVEIQQNARLAMAEMAHQLRMAGYFPENFTTPPAAPRLADPVRVATDGYLAVYGDADDSGVSSLFMYCLEGERVRRGRGATDDEAAFDCANGAVLAENVVELRFAFYDEEGQSIPDPATAPYALDDQVAGSLPDMADTTERDRVRRIVVTLTVREDLRLDEEQVYSLTSDVTLRNAG